MKDVFSDSQFRQNDVILRHVSDDLFVFGDCAGAAVDFCDTSGVRLFSYQISGVSRNISNITGK